MEICQRAKKHIQSQARVGGVECASRQIDTRRGRRQEFLHGYWSFSLVILSSLCAPSYLSENICASETAECTIALEG